jgi:hypothetical protein
VGALDCDMIEISGEGDIVGSLGQNSGKPSKGGPGGTAAGWPPGQGRRMGPSEPARNMIGLGTRELSNLRIRENGLVAPVFIRVQKRHESCARSRTETNREGGMEGDRGF